jgi:hypothetical protein
MRTRLVAIAALAIPLLTASVIAAQPAAADSAGSAMYTPTSTSESNAYARVIQLEHAGSRNGELLGTFEHWYADGTPSHYIVRSSTDNGATWSTTATVSDPQTGPGHPVSQMWQPTLFEFPHQIGRYPAGTIMLMGNLVPADGSSTVFYSWRSTDHGRTWKPVGVVQQGGTFGKGIWEPFIALDRTGRLVTYFSDERDFAQHSQQLDEIVSTDGADTWGAATPVVASAITADRPGMATVTRMGPHGKYVMSYEVCGRANCEVRIKFSPDGTNWGSPSDIGQRVVTTDNRYLGHSPFITWLPAQHALALAGQSVYSTVDNQPTGETYRSVFLNTDGGRGAWSWAPAPWRVSNASSACNANYSPDLLATAGGALRYTAPTSTGSTGPCAENTGATTIGALPFHDQFGTAGDAGWDNYGGSWQVAGSTYSASGDDGPTAFTGSTGWGDYTVTADVEATSTTGEVGLLARASNPAVGADSHQGYLAFFDVAAKTLTIARQDYAYEPLTSVPVTVAPNTWYRLSLTVRGEALTATLRPAAGGAASTVSTTDPYDSFPTGMAGLRVHGGTAAFRNVTITAG